MAEDTTDLTVYYIETSMSTTIKVPSQKLLTDEIQNRLVQEGCRSASKVLNLEGSGVRLHGQFSAPVHEKMKMKDYDGDLMVYLHKDDEAHGLQGKLKSAYEAHEKLADQVADQLSLDIPSGSGSGKSSGRKSRQKKKAQVQELAQEESSVSKKSEKGIVTQIKELRSEGRDFEFQNQVSLLQNEVAEVKVENVKLQKEVAEVKKENVNLQKEVAEVKKENVNLQKENVKLQKEVAEVKKENVNLQKENVKLQKEVAEVKVENVKLEKEVAEVKKENVKLHTQVIGVEREVADLRKLTNKNTLLAQKIRLRVAMETAYEKIIKQIGRSPDDKNPAEYIATITDEERSKFDITQGTLHLISKLKKKLNQAAHTATIVDIASAVTAQTKRWRELFTYCYEQDADALLFEILEYDF